MRTKWLLLSLLVPASSGQQLAVRVTPANPLVADLVQLEVETTAPRGISVELPDSVQLDCAAVTESADMPPRPAAGGRILYRRTFTLDLNGPGPCRVPPMTALYGENPIASPELVFHVRSALAGEASPDIHDDLAIVPYRKAGGGPWPAIGGAALAIVGGTLVLLVSRHKWRTVRRERAEAYARRALSELTVNRSGEFWLELSGILAEYLRRRFGIRATRRTSEEIVESLRGLGVVTEECDRALRTLLAECDRGRYSGDRAAADHLRAIELCREIVDALGAQAASTPRLVQRWDHAAV